MFKSVSNFVFVKSTEKSLWLLAVWQLPMPSSVEFFRDASGARRTSLTNPLVLKLPRSFLSLYIARFTFVSFSINHLALFVNSALEEGVHDSVCHCHPLIAFWDQMNFLTCGLDVSAALFSASWNLTRKSSMLKLSLLFLRLYIAQHILWADEIITRLCWLIRLTKIEYLT